MSTNWILLASAILIVMCVDGKKDCPSDCPSSPLIPVIDDTDLGLVLPPELFESTRLSNLLARPSPQFKMKRDYDFVRFGRSAPSKKASYDYIRFGRK